MCVHCKALIIKSLYWRHLMFLTLQLSRWVVLEHAWSMFHRAINSHILLFYIQAIKEVLHAKYLGVIIDQHLTWNEHTNYVTSKVNKVKCFLQRNMKSCPTTVKTTCYNSLIRSILDYASIIWSPYTQKKHLISWVSTKKGCQICHQ